MISSINSTSFSYSVVIPFGKNYNELIDTIKSIERQRIPPESIVIVVNGGEILTESSFCDLFNNDQIRVISSYVNLSDVRNANIARNEGAKRVNSDWIVFLDSDDCLVTDWGILVHDFALSPDVDFIYGSINVMSANGDYVVSAYDVGNYKSPQEYLLSYHAAQTSAFVVRRSFLKQVSWDESILRHQDYDFFVRAIESCNEYACISSVLIDVNWTAPRRHKLFYHCFDVVSPWRAMVRPRLYIRHLYYLTKSAFASRDWRSFFRGLTEIFSNPVTISRALIDSDLPSRNRIK